MGDLELVVVECCFGGAAACAATAGHSLGADTVAICACGERARQAAVLLSQCCALSRKPLRLQEVIEAHGHDGCQRRALRGRGRPQRRTPPLGRGVMGGTIPPPPH